jgi:hypothetical protein
MVCRRNGQSQNCSLPGRQHSANIAQGLDLTDCMLLFMMYDNAHLDCAPDNVTNACHSHRPSGNSPRDGGAAAVVLAAGVC